MQSAKFDNILQTLLSKKTENVNWITKYHTAMRLKKNKKNCSYSHPWDDSEGSTVKDDPGEVSSDSSAFLHKVVTCLE